MSGTTYVVTLALQTQGGFGTQVGQLGQKASKAHSQIATLGHSFDRAGEAVERFGGRVGGVFESVADTMGSAAATVGKFAGAAGIGLAAYGVAKLNNNLEQTQISLGAIFQAQGFASSFEDAFAGAGDQLARMKQDVKTLPGDLGQLADIMKTIATPAAQARALPDDIRKLAGRTMLTSTILGVPQEVASREMAGLLSGRAGAHNILGTRLGLVGDAAQKFNKETPDQRLAVVNKELDKYQGAADRFSHSFIANWTTMIDNLKYSMLAPATGGLFERVTHGIAEANGYLDDHKEKVAEIASLVNRRLVAAWDAGETALKKYGPILGHYADQIAHMQPAQLGQQLEHAAKVYGELKLGGMAIGAGSSMVGTGMKGMGSLASMGGASGLAGGLATLANPVTLGAAAAAMALLGTGAVATAGAVHILTDSNSIYHAQAVAMAESIRTHGVEVFERMAQAANLLHIDLLADKMGKDLLFGIESATTGLSLFVNSLDWVGNEAQRIHDKLLGNTPTLLPDNPGATKEHEWPTLPHLVQMDKTSLSALGRVSKVGGGGGGGGTKMDVTIKIEGAGDPSRIARLVQTKINELARNPKSSPHVPDFNHPDGGHGAPGGGSGMPMF